jgi:hypothetical protein
MSDKKEFLHTEKFTTSKGETLYLTMENIDPSWELYVNSAMSLLSGGNQFIGTCGGILDIYNKLKEEKSSLKDFLTTRTFPNFWTSDMKIFKQICYDISKCNFNKGTPKYKEMLSINHASSGMNTRSQKYVVYATKYPIKVPFGSRKSEKEGFAHFHDLYEDIIMSVGVTIDYDSGIVENRGIFRNPLSIIHNDYRNISMLLHRFTCKTMKEFFAGVNTFCVRPMPKMAEILFASLPKENLTIDGKKADEYDGDFICEYKFLIPIDDVLL